MPKTVGNNVYEQLPETPCVFKPLGISKYQSVARLLQPDELVKLAVDEDGIGIYNLVYQKFGRVPPYLELVLKPYIDATPDGFYYAKVKSVSGKQTVGAWLVLLESPTLPEFLTSAKTEMSLWYGKVAGTTFEDRQRWWRKVEEVILLESQYPHIAIQKEDSNPYDPNALKVLAYFPAEHWQQLGYVKREDAKDIRMASASGMKFYARLISAGKSDSGSIGGVIEIVGMVGAVDGFEALT